MLVSAVHICGYKTGNWQHHCRGCELKHLKQTYKSLLLSLSLFVFLSGWPASPSVNPSGWRCLPIVTEPLQWRPLNSLQALPSLTALDLLHYQHNKLSEQSHTLWLTFQLANTSHQSISKARLAVYLNSWSSLSPGKKAHG